MASRRRSSETLMKTMWQFPASLVSVMCRPIAFRPRTVPSAIVASSVGPNGSVPSTQIVKGASGESSRSLR